MQRPHTVMWYMLNTANAKCELHTELFLLHGRIGESCLEIQPMGFDFVLLCSCWRLNESPLKAALRNRGAA